ncbi:4-phosphopantetheinyl transferase family protein [Calidifontibacter indicus]|uniref:ORC-CDC6 family AAA ATPase n=1 Tax=Calidifontibacter indicus TaxID=419650 RepID=UPI0011C06BD1|nr:4-phosphopantetheinyl transferase family protein [Calidifontibacter indicus]
MSSIVARSERQPDTEVLRETYVETGVMPQVANFGHQILYGRRGTGKTHVLQVLAAEMEERDDVFSIYIDIRLLGSAHMFTDPTQPLAPRCIALYKDFLSLLQSRLLDIATAPDRDGSGLQEVDELARFITEKTADVTRRDVKSTSVTDSGSNAGAHAGVNATGPNISVTLGAKSNDSQTNEVAFTEALRETIVYSEVYQLLDAALGAMGVDNLLLLIDEWTSIPTDLQPFIAEFLKRSVLPSRRVTVKIGSLEYRSRFNLPQDEGGNVVGFELGPDITANLDLDDYYVYERNPERVEDIFAALLYRHVASGIEAQALEEHGVRDATGFRARVFTERATFVELVRSGEGVVRDFLGIFGAAYFKATGSGRKKIDLHSVEEAARDWYETDKSASLSHAQHAALQRIIRDVIGERQTKMFMLSREHSDHPMIHSLFDLRLLHLIERGYSDKENPGLRYNIYALDYGTYVDLKRTNVEPEGVLIDVAESAEDDSGRLVPLADKRSIRRVILQPTIFDDL